jgi:hypothetical protein
MQKFSKAGSGVFQGCHAVPLQTEEAEPKKQNPSTKERSSTVLRFASFPRSIVRDSGRLSRVEMNALRAPLTASQNLKMTCANFPLDGADDFIDERNDSINNVGSRGRVDFGGVNQPLALVRAFAAGVAVSVVDRGSGRK